MSLTLKPHELRAIEQQVEELRILNTKLNAQIKKIALTKKNKSNTELESSMTQRIKGSSPAAPTCNLP